MSLNKLQAIGEQFLFTFCSDTSGGKFIEKSSGQIILTNVGVEDQGKFARWGKVVSVGSRVTDFAAGDVVLIAALHWTPGIPFENEKVWRAESKDVLAIGSEEDTYAYTF